MDLRGRQKTSKSVQKGQSWERQTGQVFLAAARPVIILFSFSVSQGRSLDPFSSSKVAPWTQFGCFFVFQGRSLDAFFSPSVTETKEKCWHFIGFIKVCEKKLLAAAGCLGWTTELQREQFSFCECHGTAARAYFFRGAGSGLGRELQGWPSVNARTP